MAHKTKNASGSSNPVERQIIDQFDATALVGLRVMVTNAAVKITDASGQVAYEIPHLRTLLASAAVARCLTPIKLRGHELRSMRKIMRLTLAALAERLDSKTAPETISRWESEAQPIGGYAEKVLRLLICDALHHEAPGVAYNGSMIAQMRVMDPWITNPGYELPYIEFQMVKMRERSGGTLVDTWDQAA